MLSAAVRHAARSVRHCSSYVKQTRFLFELKENDETCRQALKSGSFYLFHNLSPLVGKSGSSFYAPAVSGPDLLQVLRSCGEERINLEDSVLVGCTNSSIAQFALDLGSFEKSAIEEKFTGKFTDLRKAALQIDGEDGSLICKAQSLLRWHDCHQYCSKSGEPTQKNVSGSKRVCHSNGIIYYPQISPVVITLLSSGNRCLLAHQEHFPAGMYTALAGFCEIGEMLEETVRREVAEEVGLVVDTIRYSGSQHWPFPTSSLMLACQATVKDDKLEINRAEIEDARWFTLEEVIEALQVKMMPSKLPDGTLPVWLPPKFAIAHQLIQEWVQEQKALQS
ncbi:NAD(P)H pyrophosphatase NUDT13, mitochondrial [Hyla sarda]|uniref:NAD(P)H pyrophosphatase NUDT13, mitochondrial n=1 Tax=Hyla sarda TaxID=327740 RepID=UPI0024C3EFBC|nr:NAD(P)H pyrophosphatase NUDT13, mitochondrial [Hyla sarda]XP_056386420.1 NAD(P)H pyrophosphatase NUDT13, mitochondrial [Hyla sarda]